MLRTDAPRNELRGKAIPLCVLFLLAPAQPNNSVRLQLQPHQNRKRLRLTHIHSMPNLMNSDSHSRIKFNSNRTAAYQITFTQTRLWTQAGYITHFYSDWHVPPYIPHSQFHRSGPPFPSQDLLSPTAAPVQASPLPPKKLRNPSLSPANPLGHRHHFATRYSATNGILQASAGTFTTVQDTDSTICCNHLYLDTNNQVPTATPLPSRWFFIFQSHMLSARPLFPNPPNFDKIPYWNTPVFAPKRHIWSQNFPGTIPPFHILWHMQAHIEHMHQLLRIRLNRWHSNILASICNTRLTLHTLHTWLRRSLRCLALTTFKHLFETEVCFQDRAGALAIHLRYPTTIVALVDFNATRACHSA